MKKKYTAAHDWRPSIVEQVQMGARGMMDGGVRLDRTS